MVVAARGRGSGSFFEVGENIVSFANDNSLGCFFQRGRPEFCEYFGAICLVVGLVRGSDQRFQNLISNLTIRELNALVENLCL